MVLRSSRVPWHDARVTTIEDEKSAALACIGAMTDWLENGDADFNAHLYGQNLGPVIEFLFGMLLTSLKEEDAPMDRLVQLAFKVTGDDYDYG